MGKQNERLPVSSYRADRADNFTLRQIVTVFLKISVIWLKLKPLQHFASYPIDYFVVFHRTATTGVIATA